MAAQERIPGNLQPQRKRQYVDDDSLDIALLCAKLEAVKRGREEREAASRLRKQVRESARHGSNVSQGSERPQLSKRTSANDGSKRSSWYKLPTKFRQSLSTLNVNIPEHEPIEQLDFISPVLDPEERDCVLLSRDTTPPNEAFQRPQQMKTKRSSFTVLKHFTSNDREQLRRIGNAENERPTSRHRSQTVPFFKSKWMSSKQELVNVSEAKDSCRPSTVDDTLSGFVNEYTISFDTCTVHETIQHQANGIDRPKAPAPERPKWAQNEGMRSFLNLSSMLKKDKKDRPYAQVAEIRGPIDDDDDDDPMIRRPHIRSQTAPEELLCDAATRLKKEKKAKMRRTVSGLLQTLLVPNHDMSHYQVAI